MNSHESHSNSSTATLSDLSTSGKHCVFRCDQEWFSVPAVSVREISIAPGLVRVPDAHTSLIGLCHLRSEFVPVLSLGTLLGSPNERAVRPDDRLLVLNGSSVWALLIAEAASLESLETIVTPEARMDDAAATAVIGTAMFRDQIVRVLSPNSLYQLAQQTLEGLWSVHNSHSSNLRCEQGSQR